MRNLRRVALLLVLWLLAWGDLSLANVVSGVAVAIALLVAFPPDAPDHEGVRINPAGVARLVGHVLVQLVRSNAVMVGQILRPPDPRAPGVLVHHLRHPTDEVVTLVTSIIALSPGTMTVDVEPDATAISVHFFHLVDVEAARRSLAHLEHLVIGAIVRGAPSAEVASQELGS